MSWVYSVREGNRYELYEKMESRFGRGHERKCINGKYTASSKCTGCCLYDGHPGFVTDKLMKEHQCQERDCLHYLAKPKKIRGFAG